MALVDYSDSDESDAETSQPIKSSTNNSTKPTFQKVVDRSNPGKIKVSLPQTSVKDDAKDDEPPSKRAKTGGGAFGGFNSFLPAPKRSGPVTSGGGLGSGGTARKGGLAAGVSLKTGAAPGFSRDVEPVQYEAAEEELESKQSQPAHGGLSLPPPKRSEPVAKPEEEVKLVGKPTMFRPLSVARKPAKKINKQPTATSSASDISSKGSSTTATDDTKPKQRPKVNLFSMNSEPSSISPVSTGEYQPIIYEPLVQSSVNSTATTSNDINFSSQPVFEQSTSNTSTSQSLNDIASDLNLSAAERRQLFGRQKTSQNGGQTAHRVINFNTDQEYQHNEELRAAGEQAVHNPVRAIAPGKHNLKQLINAATNQKEALEESFAKGKSNRAEASSRYGW